MPTETAPAAPVDAAGLVLLRRRGIRYEVLLGRRSQKMRFMPGVFVFPGGRVDREDYVASGYGEKLAPQPRALDWPSRNKLTALARAALRETFEEAGLLVGSVGRPRLRQPNLPIWRAYREAGLTPAFGRLRLFARAVTPPISPVRFNTRFFLGVDCDIGGNLLGNGELEDLGWRPVREAKSLPLATITGLVLQEALVQAKAAGERRRTAALLFWMRPKTGRRFSLTPRPALSGSGTKSEPA